MTSLELYVEGEPVGKGSMKAFPFRRKDGKLGVSMVNANDKTATWQQRIEAAIREAMSYEMLDCPVMVECRFYLPKPKSVKRLWPSTKPDLDKLCRVVGDALEGTLLINDSRIVQWIARKQYSDTPGVSIRVERL